MRYSVSNSSVIIVGESSLEIAFALSDILNVDATISARESDVRKTETVDFHTMSKEKQLPADE